MKNFAETVVPIMRKIRPMILPYWGNVETLRQKDESPSNVVTKLDEDVEQFLAAELKKIYPDIEFVGEEFGGNRESKYMWMVDPIDGTAHFIRGLPFCTSMLALIKDGHVIFSIIYDFVNDIIYHAELGKGAFRNGERIYVSDRPVKNSYLGWETHIEKPENMNKYLKIREHSILFKSTTSGYEYTLVASGKIEGRVCFDPHGKDYDFAPGSLLVSEAGGIVANLGKTTYDYRNVNFIAANKAVYDVLTQGENATFPIVE